MSDETCTTDCCTEESCGEATLEEAVPKEVQETLQQLVAEKRAAEEEARSNAVVESKIFRVDLDEILQCIKNSPRSSRPRSLCITKIQEAIMWLGMDLKELNEENPYPDSYDPTNTKIAPTADGLKL